MALKRLDDTSRKLGETGTPFQIVECSMAAYNMPIAK